MTRQVSAEDFERDCAELLRAVRERGETVTVAAGGQAVAVLAGAGNTASPAGLVDMPRWEQWLRSMRLAFPEAAGPRDAAAPADAPQVLDKAELGFEPGAGVVGSDAGCEQVAGHLRRLGVPVSDEALLRAIYSAVLDLCEDKEVVYAEDLRVLAQERIAEAPQRLRLLSVTVTSTTGLPATAEVTLELGHGPAMRREQGDGPLDAAIKAIERLTGLAPSLENFSVVSATRGHDAMAEAVVELVLEGTTVVGAGASTNAIEAGVHAYVNALNFLMEARGRI